MTPSLRSADTTDRGLLVCFESGDQHLFPWRWLRDHSEDPISLDPANLQRNVNTFAIPADLRPVAVEHDAGSVRVIWPGDEPVTVVSARLLADVVGLLDPAAPPRWQAGAMPDPLPTITYDELMDSDDGVLRWLTDVETYGFATVTGMPTTPADAEAVARRVGYPRATIFGAMWPLSSELKDHSDSAYSQTYLEPHTDSTYVHDAPGLQMFACLERDGTGGESILVDGFAAAERVRLADPAAFEILTRVAVPGRYLEPGVHLAATRPSIRLDRRGNVEQVSFNNYDRAPFILPPDELDAWYAAYALLHRELTDRQHWQLVGLTPGQVLLFDNWRCLHGRMQYTGRRVFEGCYHNREDFESRLRVLRAVS